MFIPENHLSLAAALLPIHPELFAIRNRGYRQARNIARLDVDCMADHSLSAAVQRGIRSGAAGKKEAGQIKQSFRGMQTLINREYRSEQK